MSKIRNSLGVLVLPTVREELTWEQYKERYGIDLHSLLDIDSIGYPVLKSSDSKIIYLDQSGACEQFDYIVGKDALRIVPSTTVHTGYTETEETHIYRLIIDVPLFTLSFGHIVHLDGTTPDGFIVNTAEV